ncbi:aminopeptidase N [Aquimonas voraii]|uniref:Aminopeptidase N n=1 Tax=Aquimonas voraii TaxID=265719 RepID=A0A1G7AFF1_9GAMM|nr:aminopeptidase N [Aquimonas voraii]SDE13539.1 aminopeptidase N [Aquimonas voraii]
MSESPLIHRHDYRPPAWRIPRIGLLFELDAERTVVEAELWLEPERSRRGEALELDGEGLELEWLELDGRRLAPGDYRYDGHRLCIEGLRQPSVLRSRVAIAPSANTALEGLYTSGALLLTQCEAEGFRRITFFIDRPDVLSVYAVELRAERARFPVLLANGNPAGSGALENGRHFARWQDPHPKPCYLFAIAAGRMERVSAPYITSEGRHVEVNVWSEPGFAPRCEYALGATLRAMRWDEQRFGRCYDLDVFNIVAAQDFTMGAMENKGLNIFNARYILADIDSATDADFEAVESVIGHEYFHNWSGNRVTVRDWFQLSLKEGFTVFRDQEFTADLRSRAVKRIEDVRLLRMRQFPEDAGALAHPVRPDSYREINNFYTATVYEKGAELVRMLHTLLGEETFRRGCDLYFARWDGQAASVDAFLDAMREASGRDLLQFERWYAQSGTPEVRIEARYDAQARRCTLDIRQHTAPTPDQADKQPLHIPLAYALYGADDGPIDAVPSGDAIARSGLIELTAERHTVVFEGIDAPPLLSFLQGLSAPVRLRFDYSPAELARLARIERDPLCRWDALQQLAQSALLDASAAHAQALSEALGVLLANESVDPSFVALCWQLPEFEVLVNARPQVDIDGLLGTRRALRLKLAHDHADLLAQRYAALDAQAPDSLEAEAAAARRLKNLCLHYLGLVETDGLRAFAQFQRSGTLTDRLAALTVLIHGSAEQADAALDAFQQRVGEDLLLNDKWIAAVATRPQPAALDDVLDLLSSPHWHPRNPNRVRALLGSFARSNPAAFHRADGAGYALLFAQLPKIDALNPQVAARLLGALEAWQRFDADRRELIEAGLRGLAAQGLSRDCGEMLERLLA